MSGEEFKAKGNELLKAGKLEDAVAAYTQAIEADATQHVYFSNRSNAYSQLQRYEEALADGERAVELKPDWSRGYSRKGVALFYLGRYEEAAQAYREGLGVDASNKSFQTELQRCLAYKEAAPFLADGWEVKLQASQMTSGLMNDPEFVKKMELVRSNPMALSGLLARDEEVMRAHIVLSGREAEVREQDARARKAREDAARKRREELREREARKKEEEAKAAWEALSDDERAAVTLKNEGNAAYKEKRFEDAIAKYVEALALTPNNILLYTNQASVRMAQERWEDAVSLCQEAIDKGKETMADFEAMARAYERKGRALVKLRRYADALEALDDAILNNRTPKLAAYKNQVEQLKKKQDAQDYLDPEKGAEAKARGNEHFKAMEWGQAIAAYREAIARDPTQHVYYSNLAQTYFKVREYQLALEAATTCVEINPKFLKGIARKAQAHHHLKEYFKALQVYEEGMKLDPNYKEFVEGVQRTTYAMNATRAQGGAEAEEARAKAMADPEVQAALQDGEVQTLIRTLQAGGPQAQQEAQRMIQGSATLREKFNLLQTAGLM